MAVSKTRRHVTKNILVTPIVPVYAVDTVMATERGPAFRGRQFIMHLLKVREKGFIDVKNLIGVQIVKLL